MSIKFVRTSFFRSICEKFQDKMLDLSIKYPWIPTAGVILTLIIGCLLIKMFINLWPIIVGICVAIALLVWL